MTTKREALEVLLRLTEGELDILVARLDLDLSLLPGRVEVRATRAVAIFNQALAPDGPGLEKLVQAMRKSGPRPDPSLTPADPGAAKTILVLQSNPVDTAALELDREAALIRERVLEGGDRRFAVVTERAASVSDLSKYLLKHNPVVVHFSGHGAPNGDICLLDETGKAAVVSSRALAELLGLLQGRIECVVLNACYSAVNAQALAKRIPQVVGMSKAIGDQPAIRFAAGFYRALGFGKDYATSFRLGCIEIDLLGLPDSAVPHLHTSDRTVQASVQDSIQLHFTPDAAITRGAEVAGTRLYPVWFGTNRKPVDTADGSLRFSSDRDNRVHHGICTVSIPKSHQIGSLGSPWWKRWMTLTDDRLRVVGLNKYGEAAFWFALRKAFDGLDPAERSAFIFIHGFNVDFQEAALRAAQIGFDLKVPGMTAFFSWPSKGSVIGYDADKETVEASEGFVTDFLAKFISDSGAGRVHLLAHSMGNRLLIRSIQRIAERVTSETGVPFGQIFLAAPDVDVDVFRQLAGAYPRACRRPTLYVSSKDLALASSGLLHDYPRAGFSPPTVVVDGIDTVEVANADLSLLGHGYYGAARDVLQDMHAVLINDEPPKKRLGLRESRAEDGKLFWTIGS